MKVSNFKLALGASLATAKATIASLQVLTSTSAGAVAYTLGDETYYSPASPLLRSCSKLGGTTELLPLSVLETNGTSISAEILSELIATYSALDDVWTEDFLAGGALILSTPPGASLEASAIDWIVDSGIKYLISASEINSTSNPLSSIDDVELELLVIPAAADLQPGPYTLSLKPSQMTIHQAYKMYRDNHEAFLFGVTSVPGSDAYEPVEVYIPSYQDAWIPVPSRLYFLNDERPLAGLRIGLKDIYDLKGAQTGGGSRSYAEVFPISETTAVSVQKLLDMGAIIVGKTKTSQFAHGADPWQFLDIHYPWNPRGDGYLTAASSSSGSAAAIAAYDWIDITIGSDTRGSVRKPAAVVGSYGMRPSWGSMNLTGVIPLADEMDTAGIFARDPVLFHKVHSLWFQDSPVGANVNGSFTSMPKKIIYPVDYYPLLSPDAQDIYESFMDMLEEEFGMVRTPINLTTTLLESVSNPLITNMTAFQLGSNRLAEYISYTKVGLPLSEAWDATFPGSGFPPLDPNPRNAFLRSVNLTREDYEAAIETKTEFQDFFLSEVLRPDPESCSESLMILDMGTGGFPSYREQALNSLPGATSLTITTPGAGQSLPSNYLASMAGCPQIGLPVGQVTYQSYISLQEEVLPINVDLVAARGCDGLLLELLKRLTEKGIVKTVKTGKTAF